MALKPLTVPLPLEAWLAERARRGKPMLRFDGSRIKVIQISDAEFLASQTTPPLNNSRERLRRPR
jgi:hypothetical protein